jgi:glycerophosphoryl diester phosphodiesterase
MLKRIAKLLGLLLLIIGGVWVANLSAFAPARDGQPILLAHRGVHQAYSREGLTNETCTAERSIPPLVREIENTLPSIKAAFDAGATIVEIDIHPTTDGHFAVFHDWTLDCRTEGKGTTRDHDLAYLKTLDVGYGYTLDGGKTYPLRGTGVGMMPSLDEVLRAFPDKRFLVNHKSNDPEEGRLFAKFLQENPELARAVWGVYGGDRPVAAAIEATPGLRGAAQESLKACLLPYLAIGWSGYVPDACRNTILLIPMNYAPYLWGWPNRFLARMDGIGTTVVLRGPHGTLASEGIDTAEQAEWVPEGFDGVVWTNEIRRIAPLLLER